MTLLSRCFPEAISTEPYQLALELFKAEWLAFLLLFTVPLLFLLFYGMMIGTLKERFWLAFFTVVLGEIVAIAVFLLVVAI